MKTIHFREPLRSDPQTQAHFDPLASGWIHLHEPYRSANSDKDGGLDRISLIQIRSEAVESKKEILC